MDPDMEAGRPRPMRPRKQATQFQREAFDSMTQSTKQNRGLTAAETDTKRDTAVLDPSDNDGLDIEPAEWSDMPEVVEIIRSSADWYEDIVEPQDLDEHAVDLKWARENFPERDFYVGRVEDAVAGTVTLQDVNEDHVYLGYVYLHTDYVGQGLGRDLLDFARDEARRRGRKSMVLLAHPDAEWACRAYEKYGFEVIARGRDEVLAWQDGWLEPYYEEGFHLFRYRLR